MSKNTEINFVRQPIFKQVISLIDGISLTSLVKKHNADYDYKAFKAKTQLITVLFGIFSQRDSMTEICEGLRAMGGKLNHLGLEKAPPRVPPAMGFANSKPVTPRYKRGADLGSFLVVGSLKKLEVRLRRQGNSLSIPLSLKGMAIPS